MKCAPDCDAGAERVFAAPDKFDDGQRKIRELFRGGGPSPCQKSFEGDGIRRRGKRVAQFRRQFDDAGPPFGITQYPTKRWKFFTGEINRRHRIRRHHEFFDQLRRAIRALQFEIGKGVTGENRLRFERLQAQRAMVVTQPRELLCNPVLEPEVLIQSGNLRDSC